MIVMKFGGSSVGTAAAIGQAVAIVARYAQARPVLVVSALQGVTDALIACAHGEGDFKAVRERHLALAPEDRTVHSLLDECGMALEAVAGEPPIPAALDLIISFGERLSAPIVAAALRDAGLDAEAADARDFIRTDDRFTSAGVDFEVSRPAIRAALIPRIRKGYVPVVTGFIGATENGATTTLGRGGSDYSASVIAEALEAEELWFWKEVDGVMTVDPKSSPAARLIPRMTYDEAAELSRSGAKILHPKTMEPAARAGIPIRVRNTFRPELAGTWIGP